MFEVISSDQGLPLVAFHLKDDPDRSYDEFHVAERLRMYGWVVPAYTLAKDNEVCVVCMCMCVCKAWAAEHRRGFLHSRSWALLH